MIAQYEPKSTRTGPMPEDLNERFLEKLEQTGSVVLSVASLGIARKTIYNRRNADPDFAAAWDDALATYRQSLRERAILTADLMGAGQIKTEVGEDGEARVVLDVSQVSPGVTARLLERIDRQEALQPFEEPGPEPGPLVLAEPSQALLERVEAALGALPTKVPEA